MSQENSGNYSKKTSEDLSEKQYYVVQMDSSGLCELGEGATDFLLGILQNKPESGQAASIKHQGVAKGLASGAISIGAYVTTDSAGKLVTTTTDGDLVVGQALEAATADGDLIEIRLIMAHGYWA